MSYDDWKTTPPLDEDEPDENGGCVVCGVSVPRGQRYCGASCEQMDEKGQQ